MFVRIVSVLDWLAQRVIPEPFVLAIFLSVLFFFLGITYTPASGPDMLLFWGEGVWTLLSFTMQVSISLIAGHAIAVSQPVRSVLARLAEFPKTARGASALAAFVSIGASLINLGLGLIVGAIFAKEIGRMAQRTNRSIHYPIVCAAAYAGLMAWHGGLSGSAPLMVASRDHLLFEEIGSIPLAATIFTPLNILNSFMLLAFVPLICFFMTPKQGPYPSIPDLQHTRSAQEKRGSGGRDPNDARRPSMVRFFENNQLLSWVVVFFAAGYFVVAWNRDQLRLDLNTINLFLIIVGLALHRSPHRYYGAFYDGTAAAAGILVLFPLYAGIMGMMRSSGLAEQFSYVILSFATERTLPVYTFFSAAVVNLLAPTGGGQWLFQGPVVIHAAQVLGSSISKTILAVAYGDQWTNMLQPFWALPLLALARIRARQIIGYTFAIMLLSGWIFLISLLFLG